MIALKRIVVTSLGAYGLLGMGAPRKSEGVRVAEDNRYEKHEE